MDNYPAHLAPELTIGAVATPFEEWWKRVAGAFPNVPEDVARQWLHRHWGHSPYRWLPSGGYTFRELSWDCDRLSEIASGTNDWDFDKTVAYGKDLVKRCGGLWLVDYMVKQRDLPQPIIVLDNRDGSLDAAPFAPSYNTHPASFLIIEGHKRFELAAYLTSAGQFAPHIRIWLMERVKS